MFRAIKLSPKLYEEVEHDEAATKQIFIVLGIVAFSHGIGQSLSRLILNKPLGAVIAGASLYFVLTLIGLAIWSYLVYIIGTKLFGGEKRRVLKYGAAQVLLVLQGSFTSFLSYHFS